MEKDQKKGKSVENKKRKVKTKVKETNFLRVKRFVIKNKNILVGIGLAIVDIVLIIYVARNNVANYVNVNGEDIFIGETKNLLLGRNYITLVISAFIYLYGLLINKVLLKNKISKKNLILSFFCILLFNMIMFCIFTNRVY